MLRIPHIFAAIIGMLILSGAAAAEWTRITTEYFSVAGDAPSSELVRIAQRLELSRTVVSRALPWLKVDGGHTLQVIVFADAAEYRGFKPKRADGTPDDAVAGYFLRGETRDLITLAADASDTATVTHEYVHYVLRSNLAAPAKLPPWLDEGLAQYFQSFRPNGDGTVTLGIEPLNRMAAIRKSGSGLPSGLFATDRPLTAGTDEERASFYSWAWATVHFILSGGQLGDKFQDLLAHAAAEGPDGIKPDTAFVSQLKRYVSWGVVSSSTMDLGPIAFREPTTSTLDGPQSGLFLGELLLRLGRFDEAEAHLRKVTASAGALAAGHSLLGSCLAQSGKFEEAQKELEFAVGHGSNDPQTLFFKAYATTRAGAGLGDLDEATLSNVRASLERVVAELPDHTDARQLLALVYLSTDTNLQEAVELLRRAAVLKPEDESIQLLLARALLRQEKIEESAVIAKRLTASVDARIRVDAKELVDAATESRIARPITIFQRQGAMPWDQDYVFLKRSWLGPDDLKRIDEQLRNHNSNVLLGPMRPQEQRVLATITGVTCSNGITYAADVNGKPMTFSSSSFDGVRLAVLIEGSRSFRLDCGADLSKTPAVLTYVPGRNASAKLTLTAISFVGPTFKLQTAAEVSGYRTVVVEDDRLRKGPGDQIIYAGDLKEQERWTAITKALRKTGPGEIRTIATITHIACGDGLVRITASAAGGVLDLSSRDLPHLAVKWFTTETVGEPLVCGSDASIENVLVTYTPTADGGELKAVEFVPSGFRLPETTERSQ